MPGTNVSHPAVMSPQEFRQLRASVGTQTAFAALLGVSRSAVNRWENGITPIDQMRADHFRAVVARQRKTSAAPSP